MIQTILIVLVAVVVLIVIIAVLALRYLRADDSDTFDDIPDEPRPARRPAEQDRERPPGMPGRRPRERDQVTEAWAADRPVRTPENRAPSGLRDRGATPRQTGPQRAASQTPSRVEAASSRPTRAATRPDGPDSVTSSWDSLSDVDYWAELAADKPEITPAATARRGGEPVSDIASGARRSAARGDSGQLPVRKRHQPSRPSQPSRPISSGAARTADVGQTEQIDVRAAQAASARRNGDTAALSPDVLSRQGQSRPATGQRPDAPATQQLPQPQRSPGAQRLAGPRQGQPAPAAQPAFLPRPPAPPASPYPNGHGRGDDDPLTSPSFPAVNTSDSRSYRTRRASGGSQSDASGQHARPAASEATGRQFIDYSSAPRRTTSQPDGYPVQQQAAPPGQPATHQSPMVPAANPYGSYVSESQPTYSQAARQNGYSSAGYPETPAPSLAAAAYNGYPSGQQAASSGWYAAPAITPGSAQMAAQPLGQPADGYLPAAGLGGNGVNGGSHALNGSGHGYAGIDYSSIRYDDPLYPDPHGALPGYPSGQHAEQYDPQRYRTADPGPAQDGYGAYPGYGVGGR